MDEDEEGDAHYRRALKRLQIELVKLQRWLIAENARVLVILEGRDTAGKDGTIKRLTEHMSPRDTRVHAPGKPSDKQETEWYFQRFVPQLPAGGEFVIFNRSWYNRAGVERVMGFCTKSQTEHFLRVVPGFEDLLAQEGLHLRKYYLDITKEEQKKRLKARGKDELKQWKLSPVDAAALDKWKPYTKARDAMLERTSHPRGPWHIVFANDKKIARLEFLRDLLSTFDYPGKTAKLCRPDRAVVFEWTEEERGRLAH